ncbi:MAG: hypothetical protein II381_00550 [Victivallales bacterium]|nr:hypothetical protein [Victivallales bacterium]
MSNDFQPKAESLKLKATAKSRKLKAESHKAIKQDEKNNHLQGFPPPADEKPVFALSF